MSGLSSALPRGTHPRRTTREDSVCIKHHVVENPSLTSSRPPSAGNLSAASNIAANGEDNDATALRRALDSFNAEKWFDNLNQNASGKSNLKFVNNDSPFYLRRNRSSEESARSGRSCSQRGTIYHQPSNTRPSGSSSEDFRGVIDDLTIENRELKKRLRKYEQLHSSHLQEHKLFEVRVHGLPPAKRRQLEQSLRDFAATIGGSHDTISRGSLFVHSVPGKCIDPSKVPASLQSNSRPLDSAYASLSASGNTSIPQSQYLTEPLGQQTHTSSKEQEVHKYLQDISQVLLLKEHPMKSEKATKRLVVQRLEQLFVGRVGNTSKHSQSYQQEEVSQSAANADRQATEANGQRVVAEGDREAKIYVDPYESGEEKNGRGGTITAPADANVCLAENVAITPDQRPTRPLDLDPCRAQDAADNIQYMRHLGFDSPKMDVGTAHGEREGWIYLNLLINMAQLHTLNVTPDFVRMAISEESTKFEISKDSQSVRWKGGKDPTRTANESDKIISGKANSSAIATDEASSQSHAKSHRHSLGDSAMTVEHEQSCNWRLSNPLHSGPGNNKVSKKPTDYRPYSPLFFFDETAGCGSPRLDLRSSSTIHYADDKSGVNSKLSPTKERKSTSPRNTEEPGPITFYYGAKFCTDLSNEIIPLPACIRYARLTGIPLGRPETPFAEQPIQDAAGKDFTTCSTILDRDHRNFQGSSILQGFDFTPRCENLDTTLGHGDIALPVCGIGGVTPAENLRTKVLRKFRGIGYDYISVVRHELPLSELPSPSYTLPQFASSSSESDETDGLGGPFVDNRTSQAKVNRDGHLHQVGGRLESTSTVSSQKTLEDLSSDSSIDMLDFARKADPESIAVQEREFDQNIRMKALIEKETDISTAAIPHDNDLSVPRRGSAMFFGVPEANFRLHQAKGIKRVPSEECFPGNAKQRRFHH